MVQVHSSQAAKALDSVEPADLHPAHFYLPLLLHALRASARPSSSARPAGGKGKRTVGKTNLLRQRLAWHAVVRLSDALCVQLPTPATRLPKVSSSISRVPLCLKPGQVLLLRQLHVRRLWSRALAARGANGAAHGGSGVVHGGNGAAHDEGRADSSATSSAFSLALVHKAPTDPMGETTLRTLDGERSEVVYLDAIERAYADEKAVGVVAGVRGSMSFTLYPSPPPFPSGDRKHSAHPELVTPPPFPSGVWSIRSAAWLTQAPAVGNARWRALSHPNGQGGQRHVS